MDRAYAEPLDVRAVAAVAHCSEAHFSRSFRATFGETPHRYLQRRRVERAIPFGNSIRFTQPRS
jgi:AraC-like DNA-binding protein